MDAPQADNGNAEEALAPAAAKPPSAYPSLQLEERQDLWSDDEKMMTTPPPQPPPPPAPSSSNVRSREMTKTASPSRSPVNGRAPARIEMRSDPESGSEADVEEVARPKPQRRESSQGGKKPLANTPISAADTKIKEAEIVVSSDGDESDALRARSKKAKRVIVDETDGVSEHVRKKQKQKREDRAADAAQAAAKDKREKKTARKKQKRNKGKEKEKKRKKHPDDEDSDDLVADLNADAFARSTGTTMRKDFSARLKKFQAARKKGNPIQDSDADSSDSDSDSSSSSSSSSSSDGFIVDDEPVSKKAKGKGNKPGKKPPNKPSGIRGPNGGPSFSSSSSIMSSLASRRRLDIGEACHEYCRWLLCKIFDLNVPEAQKDQLWAAREQCQRYADDSKRMITSVAMRRQFTWYLNHYPTIVRRGLFSSQVKQHRGCAACHRKSQTCDSKLILSGKPYDRKSLMFLDPEDDREMSSDMSTDADNAVEHAKPDDHGFPYTTRHPPPRKVHIFYAGSYCASRATLYHALTHWEYQLLQNVYRSTSVKELLEARDGPQARQVTAADIDTVADIWKGKLTGQFADHRSKATELSRAK